MPTRRRPSFYTLLQWLSCIAITATAILYWHPNTSVLQFSDGTLLQWLTCIAITATSILYWHLNASVLQSSDGIAPSLNSGGEDAVSASAQDSRPTMSTLTYYMRVLRSPAISLLSPKGNSLFDEAKSAGHAVGVLDILACFQTQAEPTYCGLTTITTVLNALHVDPQRVWKGVWRWYDESVLVGGDVEMLKKVQLEGVTFLELVNLVPTDRVTLEAFYRSDCSLLEFRDRIVEATSSEGMFVVVSYSRSVLRQSGDGHFSPIAAYHAESDRALILDVARYKYPPHWISLSKLWEAMSAVDNVSGKSRGFLIISKASPTED